MTDKTDGKGDSHYGHDHHHESSPQAIRAEALESLLIDRGLLKASDVDNVIVQYEERVGPMNGAKVVARAWKDPAFKTRLLNDGTKTIQDFKFEGGQTEKLVVVANESNIHNVVVCTLCSCYPWAVLGLPPKWYKDPAYRSRIVREPRKLLGEMGLRLPSDTEIKVWDSSAEVRYMVLPEQPAGTENMTESELAHRVSRDAMIGVAHA